MNSSSPKFHFRQFFSVLILLMFIVLVVSGFVLFLTPAGRIAHPTNWTLMGLDKDQWADLHFVLSVLFIISSVFHLIYNWKAFASYFKNHLSKKFQFKKEWLTALIIFVFISFLSVSSVWPFDELKNLREYFRHEYWEPDGSDFTPGKHLNRNEGNRQHNESGMQHHESEKPHEGLHKNHEGHHSGEKLRYGRMSLQNAMERVGIDKTELKKRLEAAGYSDFKMNESLRAISARKGHTPHELFDIIAGE